MKSSEVAEFKDSVLRWQRTLNLMDWTILINEVSADSAKKDRKGVRWKYCVVQCDPCQHLAVLFLNLEARYWNAETPADVAKHEMLHVLLSALTRMSEEYGWTSTAVDSEEHRVVRTLMKLL